MTTYATITADQIRNLRAEAATAGDTAQVNLCNLALDCPPLLHSSEPAAHRAMNLALRQQARDARAKCAEVIADAAAQG